ncbi:MAG: hypothetical protein IKZ87_04165 [Actinomycetaceae bacterium]|nr:hypothetical protein [Actinomycetaceae bacterium]
MCDCDVTCCETVLYQYPMHIYGWSEYQVRYGSAMPAFGPELYLKIPRELKADAIIIEGDEQ